MSGRGGSATCAPPLAGLCCVHCSSSCRVFLSYVAAAWLPILIGCGPAVLSLLLFYLFAFQTARPHDTVWRPRLKGPRKGAARESFQMCRRGLPPLWRPVAVAVTVAMTMAVPALRHLRARRGQTPGQWPGCRSVASVRPVAPPAAGRGGGATPPPPPCRRVQRGWWHPRRVRAPPASTRRSNGLRGGCAVLLVRGPSHCTTCYGHGRV